MEEFSAYDCEFVYVKGCNNSGADALSRHPHTIVENTVLAESNAHHPYNTCNTKPYAILNSEKTKNILMATTAALTANLEELAPTRVKTLVSIDDSFIAGCRSRYQMDGWCKKLISASKGMPELTVKDGLWFIGECLIVPAHGGLCEEILHLAHDTLGHFVFYKSYESIRQLYFWPGMRKDLEEGYIPSYHDLMQNKSFTTKPTGSLHPLPVPDERCLSVSLDFIGPLPIDNGFDCILTITDRLGSELRIIPMNTTLIVQLYFLTIGTVKMVSQMTSFLTGISYLFQNSGLIQSIN